MVRSGTVTTTGVMVVGSLAVSLEVLVSPPPDTETELVTMDAAFADTLTVSVIAGKLAPAASGVLLVQVNVPNVHVQPEPDIAVAVSPAGSVSTTVTVALVEPVPAFCTVMV